jgi:protein-S-isoprenylcysteine O-methyltransferase Ste14
MNRPAAAVGSFAFLLAAPGTIAGLIPWSMTGWRLPAHAPRPLQAAGAALIVAGLWLIVECFARFALQGRGTPAPIAPPERLVVSGPYRRVRNPMYVAVTALNLGQAALFADMRLLVYAGVVWTLFHLFVLVYEEPTLRGAFPADYAAYFAAVPRWIPRITPWRGA